ncbi:MAG TPA: hypothetical protein VFF73_41050 [Planctomycetota bacterium]|nr:hypothetical protein [Planctomycetota bacterium]
MARRRGSSTRSYEELEKAVNDLEDSLKKLNAGVGDAGKSLQGLVGFIGAASPVTGNLQYAASTFASLATNLFPSAMRGLPGAGAVREAVGWGEATGNALDRAQAFASNLAIAGVPEDRIRGMLDQGVPLLQLQEERAARARRIAADIVHDRTAERVGSAREAARADLSGAGSDFGPGSSNRDFLGGSPDTPGEALQRFLRPQRADGFGSTNLMQGVSSAFRQMLKAGSVEAK